VSLIVRETDSGIAHIGKNPMVSAVPGTIRYGESRVVCLLLRVSEDPRCTYETLFDLMRPECVEDLKALSKHNQLSVIIVGETTWTCVEAPMPGLGANIWAHADVVLSNDHQWSKEEFMAGVEAMQSLTNNTAELWGIFEREGQALEIRTKN
jgi:hypothetical protein